MGDFRAIDACEHESECGDAAHLESRKHPGVIAVLQECLFQFSQAMLAGHLQSDLRKEGGVLRMGV